MKVFNFRLTPANQDQASWDEHKLAKVLKNWCSKWVFQIEAGARTGKFHYQCKLSSKSKTTKAAMLNRLNAVILQGDSYCLEPTCEQNQGSMFYVINEGTRVRGPWTDKDVKTRYVQRRFRNPVLKTWQERLATEINRRKENAQKPGYDREILMVHDVGERAGKSFFKGYMKSRGAIVLPLTTVDSGDMVRALMAQVTEGEETVHTVMVDVPRTAHAKHWFALSSGLKAIKQGHLYDERNSWREATIEPPVVVCFMNSVPPKEFSMSLDAFKYFDINAKPASNCGGAADSPN